MKIGAKVWHAKRLNSKNAEIGEYSKAVSYTTRANYLTVVPATARGGLAMMQFGEDIDDIWTVVANSLFFDGVFKEGDLMWVDGESPISHIESEYGFGSSATAEVISASCVNRTVSITLSRNKKQIKQ